MAIEVHIDDRIRVVSSVMLLTDFVHENEKCGRPHPLKTRTIEYLSSHVSHPCVDVARKLAAKYWMYSFHSYAIQRCERVGNFYPVGEAPPQEDPLKEDDFKDFTDANFGSLLHQFYIDSELQTLWDATESDWEAARADCADIVRTSGLDEFIDLFFGKSKYHMSLIPNPLDPPTFGFAPNDGCTAYAILGPPAIHDKSDMPGRYISDRKMIADIAFHEFAHPLWSSSREAYPAIVDETAALQDTMEYKGYFPKSYDTWDSKLNEIVIRAATAHYVAHRDGNLEAQAFLEREKSWYGIGLIDTVFLALGRYLEARKCGEYNSLSEFLPALSDMMRTTPDAL